MQRLAHTLLYGILAVGLFAFTNEPARGACAQDPVEKRDPPEKKGREKQDRTKKQDPPEKVSKKEIERLREKLDDDRLPVEKREKILRVFLESVRGRTLPGDEDKKLRIKLATLELAVRKPWQALERYKQAEALCQPGQKDLYFRATCRLGIARCYELLDDENEAIRRYSRIRVLFLGMPQAREAKAALERLRAKQRVKIGRALTLPKKTVSVLGRTVRAASGKEPTLLLFFATLGSKESPRLPRPIRDLDTNLPLRLVISAPRRDARRWHDTLRKTPWGKRAITLRDRVDRHFGIASVPTWLLLDRDGTVLEINPSRRRLEAIFRDR